MTYRPLRTAFAGLIGLGLFAAGAQADEIVGTDFNVIYNPATLGLFGTLNLSGDTLEFTPNNFIAISTNGQGVVTPSGSGTASGIQLVAHPGFRFGSLQLAEFGDYQLSGANSSVGLSGELIAFDGDPGADPGATYTTSTIAANGSLTVNTGMSNTQNWNAGAAINNATPTAFGSGGAWLATAGTVDVSIENLLSASTATTDSLALIQKKAAFGGVGLTVTPVPLPASIWLLGPALFAVLGAVSRRRMNADI